MSERSYARWLKQPGIAHALLSRFDVVMAQSQRDGERFSRLGAPRVMLGGNLKYDVTPPPADPAALAMLQGVTSGRPIWVAASTHPGEEEMIIDAHRRVAERLPGLLTIIAPRHPQRGQDIAALSRSMAVATGLRSAGDIPDPAVDIYVADTLGELGLFFRLAPVAFLGATLVPRGGHNPVEPAKLGVAIIHGPHVDNNRDIYGSLDKSGGAIQVPDTGALAGQVLHWLTHANEARTTGRLAAQGVAALTGATDRIMQAIDPLLARAGLMARRAEP
jgi:3-deoxy-D-manno-octulosonic-acid transferase